MRSALTSSHDDNPNHRVLPPDHARNHPSNVVVYETGRIAAPASDRPSSSRSSRVVSPIVLGHNGANGPPSTTARRPPWATRSSQSRFAATWVRRLFPAHPRLKPLDRRRRGPSSPAPPDSIRARSLDADRLFLRKRAHRCGRPRLGSHASRASTPTPCPAEPRRPTHSRCIPPKAARPVAHTR